MKYDPLGRTKAPQPRQENAEQANLIERSIVDFVCFEARLIVEADGPLHDDAEHRLADVRRDALLLEQGFRVLRFDQDMVLGDLAGAIGGIRQSRADAPSPAPFASERGTLSRSGEG